MFVLFAFSNVCVRGKHSEKKWLSRCHTIQNLRHKKRRKASRKAGRDLRIENCYNFLVSMDGLYVRDFSLERDYNIIFSSCVFHYIPNELCRSVIDSLKMHTTANGINVINVFVKKPFIPLPPDIEESEIAAGNWKSGELFMYYHDWLFHKNEERIFDCNSSGIPHKHCMDVLIAEKF